MTKILPKIGFFILAALIGIFSFTLVCWIVGINFNYANDDKNSNSASNNKTTITTDISKDSSNDLTNNKINDRNDLNLGSRFCDNEKINISVYEKTHKSVVNINSEYVEMYFFQPYWMEGGGGSGSIIDTKGHILTNYHVIETVLKHSKSVLWVTLFDKSKYQASIIGIDRDNDIAIIKISAPKSKLHPIEIYKGNQTLKVGQKVLAIGNPFGLERTLTTGIISSLGRTIMASEDVILENIIQTDAAINPGNSGGPLLNSFGKIIGVNTAISTPDRGSVGIGFAISFETINRVVPDLIKYSKVKRPVLGLSLGIALTERPGLIRQLNIKVKKGVLIILVEKDSALNQAGTKSMKRMGYNWAYDLPVDIIVRINDRRIVTPQDIRLEIKNKRIGDKVTIYVQRGEKLIEKEVILKEGTALY